MKPPRLALSPDERTKRERQEKRDKLRRDRAELRARMRFDIAHQVLATATELDAPQYVLDALCRWIQEES